MKALKVLSLVALLVPGLSYAEVETVAEHHGAAKTEVKVEVPAEKAPEAVPAEVDPATPVAPSAGTEEKTETKTFCAKTADKATKDCTVWLNKKTKAHKSKVVHSNCSEAAAATKEDKGCKAGLHVSHGEVRFHK